MKIYLANIRKLSLKFKESKLSSLKTVYLTKFKELQKCTFEFIKWKKKSQFTFDLNLPMTRFCKTRSMILRQMFSNCCMI